LTILNIKIAKASVAAKGDNPGHIATVEVDTDRIINEATYSLIFATGLETILNSRMSAKLVGAVTKKTGKDLEEAQAAAMKIAQENLDNIYNGEVKAKKSKFKSLDADGKAIPQAVMTEALRQAREVVRNEIRKAGQKISQYKASQITEYAKSVIAADASYIAKAREALDARSAIVAAIDVSVFKPDPELVKKAKAKADEKAATLSKTQAGIPTRRKPGARTAQHAVH
jgi:hypothetical protein